MPPLARHRLWARAPFVTLVYVAVSLATTWPLVTVMTRQIAGDTGDPLFICWILLWTSGQVLQALHGDWSALSRYWNGNIFYPAPLTLTYSEHFAPQMLQALPIFAATDNIILCYNALLLATIVLSGLGMYLLVRELTGEPMAAFLAGLAFACAPYRIDQLPHLQVLSSQWMPFALYGFRRFFVAGRLRSLVGGVIALLAQGLSSVYYLFYFTPFAVAYCLHEMAAHGQFWNVRRWRTLLVVGGSGLLVVCVFLWPYEQVRRLGDVGVRAPDMIELYSADTHAFATTASNARLWGSRIRAMPRPEGQGFPGLTILLFAATAMGLAIAQAVTCGREARARPAAPWQRAAVVVLGAALLAFLWALGYTLVTGRTALKVPHVFTTPRNPIRSQVYIALVVSMLTAVSPQWRSVMRRLPRSTVGFFAGGAVAAAWLSLGPVIHVNGLSIGWGVYDLFYRWVPGWDGLRAPSRNFMLVSFFLSVLAGLGAATVIANRARAWRLLLVVGMVAIVAEGWSAPIDTNRPVGSPGYVSPPPVTATGKQVPPLYRLIRDLPATTVVAEFPFGDPAYEIFYSFYAGYHRKPILNGYSGFFPESYQWNRERFSRGSRDEDMWNALLSSGATHVIVHEGAYGPQGAPELLERLRRHGAREISVFDSDHVFQLH